MTADPGAFRDGLFAAILPVLDADPGVRGVWEGGSVATGRADAFSDIDLCVVAEMGRHDAVLDAIEAALAGVAAISHTWQVDPPPYAGVTQRIYQLQNAPAYFMLDCALMSPAASGSFLERERHGDPRVLLDRDGTLVAMPLDRAAHAQRMAKRLAQIRGAWPVYRSLVEKELARGRALDAIGFYMNGLMRPLLELAGMRYRPERYDFGWRYLHADLPPDLQHTLQRLAYVADPAALRDRLPQLDRVADQLFTALSATLPAAGLAPGPHTAS